MRSAVWVSELAQSTPVLLRVLLWSTPLLMTLRILLGYEGALLACGTLLAGGLPVALGIGLLSEEYEKGALRYFWGWPIRRSDWLRVKLATAALASLAVTGFGFAVLSLWPSGWSFVDSASGTGFGQTPIGEIASRMGVGRGRMVLLYAALAFFGFAGGVLAMLGCPKSKYVTLLIAPIAGLGVVASGLTVAWSGGGVAAGGMAAVLACGGAVLLAGAWIVFKRRNPLLDEPWVWFLLASATVAVATVGMAMTGGMIATMNRGPGWVTVLVDPPPPTLRTRPGGGGVLITQAPPGEAWTEVYNAAGVLQRRFDGFVAASVGASIWRPGADSRGEQVLLHPMRKPDAGWGLGLRMTDRSTLVLGDVATGAVRTLQQAGHRRRPRTLPGWFAWTRDGARLVGMASNRVGHVALRMLDPETGETVDRSPADGGPSELIGLDGGTALVAFRREEETSSQDARTSPPRMEVVRLDLETGAEQRVALPERAYQLSATDDPAVWMVLRYTTVDDRLRPEVVAWDWAEGHKRVLANNVPLRSAGWFDLLERNYSPPYAESDRSGRVVLVEEGFSVGGYGFGGGVYGPYGSGYAGPGRQSSELDLGPRRWLLRSVREGFVAWPPQVGRSAGLNFAGTRCLVREDRVSTAGDRNCVYRVLSVPPPPGGVDLEDLPAVASVSDSAGWLDDTRFVYAKRGEDADEVVWWVRNAETGHEVPFVADGP